MTNSADWATEAFLPESAKTSIDGGTTSAGVLWHGLSPRWGHSMHTMCSYQGMFPARVAHYFIQKYTKQGATVADPFSGRGTTALQARAEGRRAFSNDLSPLAYVLSKAKSQAPSWNGLQNYITSLERGFRRTEWAKVDVSPDIAMLYHPNTLRQLVYLRSMLISRPITEWSSLELMVAGALAGIMHGGWRRDGTSQYLSISMPNTFSMSPVYVAKYIEENSLAKIDQDVFAALRVKVGRLYLDELCGPEGQTFFEDASEMLQGQVAPRGGADLIVTSPPYLQVVNYGSANWIRLWLLGIDDVARENGAGRKKLDAALDHRHNYDSYREFMLGTLIAAQRALKPNGVAVFVIGDVADPGKAPVPLAAQIWKDVEASTELRLVEIVEDDLPVQTKVSRIWGETKGQATNRDCALVLTGRKSDPFIFGEQIDWSEPYKDAGPDEAHARTRPR